MLSFHFFISLIYNRLPARGTVVADLVGMRFAKLKSSASVVPNTDRLRIGYVPTVDCATLIVAHELGLFARQGLSVKLSREIGWATIREKLLHEELHAVAAHASMAVSLYFGLGVIRRPCVTGLFLAANGSAITLSSALWNAGACNAASLARVIKNRGGGSPLQFGVVLQSSTQHLALRRWLVSGGISPDRDVKIVIVPSAHVCGMFKQGFLDGYCVAEPWNSTAVLDGIGHVVATSEDILGEHPEKALLVLQDFAERREDEHLRILAALIEAGRFCEDPANRREMVSLLAKPCYFDVEKRYLANALLGPFDAGNHAKSGLKMVSYDLERIGIPTRTRAKWFFDLAHDLAEESLRAGMNPDVVGKIFRPELFAKALKLSAGPSSAPQSVVSPFPAHRFTATTFPRGSLKLAN
jgi:two-component system, oxyanion-binding sensor